MNDNYKLLSALNGIAVKCLIAFWWEKRQLTVTELEPRVGHDKNTVRKALAQLALFGLSAKVISSQETWCLTSQGYQLPLRDALPTPADALMSPVGENFSPHVTTTTTAFNPDLRNLTSSSSSSKSGENLTSPQSANVAENEATLKGRGIMGRKAAAIARLEWVDPDYINAHVDQVQRDGDRLGLAIKRMEDGDPAPKQETVAESWDRLKYISGKYADHIEH